MIHPKLPEHDCSLVIRTDFSNDAAWEELCTAIQAPQTEHQFRASVECISDKACSGLTQEMVASMLPPGSQRSFVFLADSDAISQPDYPMLVVDLLTEPGRTFRVNPAEAWSVENNLRLANMDFAEFADAVDPDGVFREFPGTPK